MNITSHNGQHYWSRVDVAQKAVAHTRSSVGTFVMDSEGSLPATEQPNLFVVHMDDNFLVIYYCNVFNGAKINGVWLLSRDRNPNFFKLKVVEWGLEPQGIFLDLQTVSQKKCPPIEGKRRKQKIKKDRKKSDLVFF